MWFYKLTNLTDINGNIVPTVWVDIYPNIYDKWKKREDEKNKDIENWKKLVEENLKKLNATRARISNTKKDTLIELEIPGYKKENVKISLENYVLTISGERTSKETGFTEKITLNSSNNYNLDNIIAKIEDGILYITLFKLANTINSKQIIIQ